MSVLVCSALAFAEPRSAKVAGAFYPDDPQVLRRVVTELLDRHPAPAPSAPAPGILIAPHAGYAYSGVVAARAFREVQGRSYDGIVVVGFAHREHFDGTSVDDREAYQTPLGLIPVDLEVVEWLKQQRGITHVESAHESSEHSLEVMLPFLQVALAPREGAGLAPGQRPGLGEFRLVPLLMGSMDFQDASDLADALATLAQRGRYLFIFSTDLSHYHPYQRAVERDELTTTMLRLETAQAVGRLFSQERLEACGRGPVVTGLLLAQRLGYWDRRLLLYANSGDTTGEKERVVGYAALAMYPSTASSGAGLISPEAGAALVRAARATIAHHLDPAQPEPESLDHLGELRESHGVFVTLRRRTGPAPSRGAGELRGCMGRIESDTPLVDLLPAIALEAALRDPRFPPLRVGELDEVSVEVSVLSPPRPVTFQGIVAGRDGVVLRQGDHGGVFLPQVWDETGWTRLEFLRELAHQKAGLPPDAWQSAELFTFQDEVFQER